MATRQPAAGKRRTRLARGPLTIGDPAPAVDVRLADSEPYRPDSIADGGQVFDLTVRAASVRGLAKRFSGQPRQDDFCLRRHQPTMSLIAAVADGVSAAPRSDLAAALAVRQAAAAVARQLDASSGADRLVEPDWQAVFDHAAWALVEEQRRHTGQADAGIREAADELATTLLVAVVCGGRVRVAAVGDSAAYRLRDGSLSELLEGPADTDGLLGARVQALPSSARELRAGEYELAADEVLLLCTDGLALPLAGGRGEVAAVIARELATMPDIVDFARLLDFSRSTYDDDRTLVAVWNSP